jgi:hypothetical protein
MTARPLLAVLVVVAGLAGCGHSLEPTDRYRTPESIPRPELVTASPGVRGVTVTWLSAPEEFGVIDGWNVYRAEGEAIPGAPAYSRLNDILVQESAYLDTGVVTGTRYWYRVAAVTPAGVQSLPSDPAIVVVDFTPPAPPAGLRATILQEGPAGPFRVRLAWEASLEPDHSHYNLFRAPPIPGLPFVAGLPRAEYLDIRVQPDSTYRYWCTAVDMSLNESAPGDTLTVTVKL